MNLKKFRNKGILFLVLIVFLGLFLRSLNFKETFIYAHDGDLGAWIVKDIVFDRHLRLIGQETSTQGVFIGPLYYYTLIPFYFLANWEPIGGVYFGIFVGAVTIISFYHVFTKLFDKTTGFIAAIVQAVLNFNVSYDRWVVPTFTTNLWTIWFFYCVMMILRGNLYVLSILGILAGLIWHINLSLAPLFLLIPPALIFCRKIPTIKHIILFFGSFLITTIPYWLFELRHGFFQTRTILTSFSTNQGGGTGLDKLNLIFIKILGNITTLFFHPVRSAGIFNYIVFFGILILGFVLLKKKIINKQILILFYSWIGLMLIAFTILSKEISEYYFHNINIIFLALVILTISYIYRIQKIGKILICLLFILMFIQTFNYFNSKTDYDQKGYLERKRVVQYIKDEITKRNLPCISVSYLTGRGEEVGFRYLFYLNNMHVNQPKSESPNFTIVSPPELSSDSVKFISGAFGIIPPDKEYSKEQISISCSGQNSNLTDPMLGFTY